MCSFTLFWGHFFSGLCIWSFSISFGKQGAELLSLAHFDSQRKKCSALLARFSPFLPPLGHVLSPWSLLAYLFILLCLIRSITTDSLRANSFTLGRSTEATTWRSISQTSSMSLQAWLPAWLGGMHRKEGEHHKPMETTDTTLIF